MADIYEMNNSRDPNESHEEPPGSSRRRRSTRGKGRKITYWDDKAIQPPNPPECPECGGKRVLESLGTLVCSNCGQTT